MRGCGEGQSLIPTAVHKQTSLQIVCVHNLYYNFWTYVGIYLLNIQSKLVFLMVLDTDHKRRKQNSLFGNKHKIIRKKILMVSTQLFKTRRGKTFVTPTFGDAKVLSKIKTKKRRVNTK